jgi:hypothetical protein
MKGRRKDNHQYCCYPTFYKKKYQRSILHFHLE